MGSSKIVEATLSKDKILFFLIQIPSDYMISESGKQTETTKGKKCGSDSVTDK